MENLTLERNICVLVSDIDPLQTRIGLVKLDALFPANSTLNIILIPHTFLQLPLVHIDSSPQSKRVVHLKTEKIVN